MSFQPVDYYGVYNQLSDEERMVRESVADFVDSEVLPIIEKHYQDGTFPMDLVPKMAELGLFGITLPQEYGCAGANYTSYGLAMQELERGDSGIRSFASVQSSLVMFPIYSYANEEMKNKWLPKLAAGTAIGCDRAQFR